MYTIVTKVTNTEDIQKKPEHGCYVKGMYLEGAHWDITNNCLKKQTSKQLIYEMPLVQINPVEANKLKLKGILKNDFLVVC